MTKANGKGVLDHIAYVVDSTKVDDSKNKGVTYNDNVVTISDSANYTD